MPKISLCKIKTEKCIKIWLGNSNPKKLIKNVNKMEMSISGKKYGELIEINTKKYNGIVCVRAEVSSKIQKIRNLIIGRKVIDKTNINDCTYISELFEFMGDEKEYQLFIEKFDFNSFCNSKENIITFNVIKNSCILKYYIYLGKAKYCDVIQKIKSDFKWYYEKDEFYIYTYDYKFFLATSDKYYEKEKISLDRVKKSNSFYYTPVILGKKECKWLSAKIGIKVDPKKINDKNYIVELKERYKNNENTFKSKYIDLTEKMEQDYKGTEFTEESNLYEYVYRTKKELEAYKIYNEQLNQKYGCNVYEVFYPLADGKFKMVISNKNKNVIYEEVVNKDYLKPWSVIYEYEEDEI